MSPTNGNLLNGVLRPKLLNIPLASCLLINPYCLLPHIAHFHDIIILSLLVFKSLEFMFFCILNETVLYLIL